MENLCGIYDGSQGAGATGYHLCQVIPMAIGTNLEHNKVIPLYCQAFSDKEKDYVSITAKIKGAINKVIKTAALVLFYAKKKIIPWLNLPLRVLIRLWVWLLIKPLLNKHRYR
jgi:hypothetical protein